MMRRRFKRPGRLWWAPILAFALCQMPIGKAHAQYLGMGYGYGYPGWGYGGWGYGGWGYPAWGWGGYGYPGIAYNYGYPGYGFGNIPVYGNFVMGAPGYGYGGLGYGYGGFGYAPGGIGMSGVGYWNPMFGVGLTPLGTSSYMMETQLLGRVPRTSTRSGGAAYRGR